MEGVKTIITLLGDLAACFWLIFIAVVCHGQLPSIKARGVVQDGHRVTAKKQYDQEYPFKTTTDNRIRGRTNHIRKESITALLL
jgi:hypothetical protein